MLSLNIAYESTEVLKDMILDLACSMEPGVLDTIEQIEMELWSRDWSHSE